MAEKSTSLTALALRFPERADQIEEMSIRPGPLSEMCEELFEAERGLAATESAPLEIREARRAEWRLAIDALIQEIERELQDTNVVPINRGHRRSPRKSGLK
jgi:hypothetical protein